MAVQQLKAAYLQIIRLAAVLGIVASAAAGCSKETDNPGDLPPKADERCVILYMPGRTLIPFYRQNLDGIVRAVDASVPGNGRILVAWQPESGKAVLQEIYYNTQKQACATQELKEYESFNAGDLADVAALLNDAVTAAPAKKYGLIIGCHGKAWVPASSGVLSSYAIGTTQLDNWIPVPGALPTRSFGDSGQELEVEDLAKAISNQKVQFEYLIFDACFMANIETLYDLRNTVDYVVASPCEIMAAGFPYDRIIPHLFTDESTIVALGKVCWEFWNFYENDWESVSSNEQSGCISLTVMSELEELATSMRNVKHGVQKTIDINTLQSYEGFNNHLFFDLGQYVEMSCADQGLVDAFNTQLERAFPKAYRFSTKQFYSAYNGQLNPINYYTGVTVSEPSKNSKATLNSTTAWYRSTH